MIPTSHDDMRMALEELDYDEIQTAFSPEIFYRGVEYCEEEAVTNLQFISDTVIEAYVLGSSRYYVLLAFRNGEITTQCDCPYDRGPCKHIAAVLLRLHKTIQKNKQHPTSESAPAPIHHQTSGGPGPDNPEDLTKQAEQLSKKELIELLVRLAPEPLKKYMAGKNTSKTKAQNLLEQVKSRIEALFRDDDLLWDPAEFDLQLSSELEILSGLQDKIPGETGDLLLNITGRINELLYEGYLDDYYNDESFSGDTYYEFVLNYATRLPFSQKVKFLDRLQACFDSNEWYTMNQVLYRPDMLFDPSERPELKNHVLKLIDRDRAQKALIYFDVISDICTDEELEQILLALHPSSDRLTLKLAELYKQQKRHKEAVKVIETYLSSDALENSIHESTLYSLLIDLKHEIGQSAITTVFRALKISPDLDLFRKAIRGIDSRLAADIAEDLRKNYNRRRNLMKRIAEVMS